MRNFLRLIWRSLLRIGFGFIFVITAPILLMWPVVALVEIRTMLQSGAPEPTVFLFFIGLCSLVLYLSVRVKAFQVIYKYLPILWPFFQMVFIMFIGLGIAASIIYQWAENNFPSREVAIFLAVLIVLVVRIFMSWWFHKHPVAPIFQSEEERK